MRFITSAIRSLSLFRRCRSGATAVDFALSFPVAIIFVTGIIELGVMMFTSVIVEGGLREASRYGVTGNGGTPTEREQAVRDIVMRHSAGMIDPATVDISFLEYNSFEQVGQGETCLAASCDASSPATDFEDQNGNGTYDEDLGVPGLGGPRSIILYQIDYEWEMVTGLFQTFIGTNGKMAMSSSIAVRNEPFGGTGESSL